MKYRIKKKQFKKILLVLIIIIIIIILVKLIGIVLDNQRLKKIKEENIKEDYPEYYEVRIFPAGIARLQYYYIKNGGECSQENYYKQCYALVNYLIELYDNLLDKTDEELYEYYDTNRDEILNNIGVANKMNFVSIVHNLQEIRLDNPNLQSLGQYKNSEIDLETISSNQDCCVFNTIIHYSNYQEGISFKTYFAYQTDRKKDKEKTDFKYVYFMAE